MLNDKKNDATDKSVSTSEHEASMAAAMSQDSGKYAGK